MPSLLELPVSLAEFIEGAAGVLGDVVSTVTLKAEDALLTLPAVSVALVLRLCAPSLSFELVIAQLPLPSVVALPKLVVPSVS